MPPHPGDRFARLLAADPDTLDASSEAGICVAWSSFCIVEMSCGDEICLLTFLNDFLREMLLVRNGGVGTVPSSVPLSARVAALVWAATSSNSS